MTLRTLLSPVLSKIPQYVESSEIEILQELPIETLYLALKEADNELVLWFFQHATPEQVQGLIDLDCWQGDQFQVERFDNYFKIMTALHPIKLGDYMKWLDPEILVRGLMGYGHVEDFDPQNPPEVDEKNLLITMDNKYAFILHDTNTDVREALYLWINKCSAFDISLLRRHLESCKWEQISDLEEFAYQMKKGRVEELGFVEREEAISLYSRGQAAALKKELLDSPLPKGAKRKAALGDPMASGDGPVANVQEQFMPELMTEPFTGQGFLAQAFKLLDNKKLSELLIQEIVRTLNMSLVADDLLFHPLIDIQRASKRAREYLDLGLTYLADGQVDDAAEMLELYPLTKVHRLGWLLVQDLVKASTELRGLHPVGGFASVDEELIDALSGRHPELPEAIQDELHLERHSFRSIASIFKVGGRIVQLSHLAKFFRIDLARAMNLDAEPLQAQESYLARLFTSLFRFASGEEISSKALSMDEWKRLAPKFKEEKFQKAFDEILARAPIEAKEFFKRQSSEQLAHLRDAVKAEVAGIHPKPQFFTTLRWSSLSQ